MSRAYDIAASPTLQENIQCVNSIAELLNLEAKLKGGSPVHASDLHRLLRTSYDVSQICYKEDTQLRMLSRSDLFHHTDENTLTRVST